MERTVRILLIGGTLIFILVIGFFWGTRAYDKAIGLQEDVTKNWANVQATYQRRADLLPNLVATVKAAGANEKDILVAVTEARTGISSSQTPEDFEKAGKQINSVINLAFEAYPQIKSVENFQDLQTQISGSENRIRVARQNFNKSVNDYNTYVRSFWISKALSLFGNGEDFSPRKGFEAGESSQNSPKVDLSK